MTTRKSEFTVRDAYRYDYTSPARWVISHVARYKFFFLGTVLLYICAFSLYTTAQVLVGRAVGEVLTASNTDALMRLVFPLNVGFAQEVFAANNTGALVRIALTILTLLCCDSLFSLTGVLSVETIAQRLEVDAREELYISLLGKSQTFHNRQRVGDVMARASEDVQQLNGMMNPGVAIILETILGITIPTIAIGTINWRLLVVPILFIIIYIFLVRRYISALEPITRRQRSQFGKMNTGLEESISGIEIVKASAQEEFERRKFRSNARLFRDFFVRQGYIEARYLPVLLYGIAMGVALLHALSLYSQGFLTIPQVISFVGAFGVLRWPTFASIFTFSLVQTGMAGARRIIALIEEETELDENASGYGAPIKGDIVFDNVTFAYGQNKVVENISFRIKAGQTVALVGQTGSGKSTLSHLINRTYDTTNGRVLIDGVDVREWNLTTLRSQISKIEQDIFLFSKTVGENIAFGSPNATQEQIEEAAKEAQAHEFILSFKDGYNTVIGERGVTLSGGQRQRIALARAFLSNPRILVLDDSTSAIDSATEDEIQKAIRRAQQGRTTILITHRLSQIRWADHILVLDKGRLVADGTHEELLRRSSQYRRIFARYDVALPPLEPVPQMV